MKGVTHKVIIDRIEGDLAVVVMHDDDKVKFNLPVVYLPKGAKGGDHLQLTLKQDKESREEMKETVEQLLKDLKGSGK